MVNTAIGSGLAKSVGGMIAMKAPAVTGAPAPSSGGYKFSREGIDEVIRDWEDLREDLVKDSEKAQQMAHVNSPGDEFASDDFTSSANPSGKAFLSATEQMIDYVEKYIEALRNARDGIAASEDNAQEDVNRTGADVIEV